MNQKQALSQLENYIRARYPIIAVISHEENRVLRAVQAVGKSREMQVYTWTVTHGLTGVAGVDADSTREPIAALEAMLNYTGEPALFIMQDLHGLLGNKSRGFDPIISRYLRDLAAHWETRKYNMILVSPTFDVPADLEKTISLIDYPLPDEADLIAIYEQAIKTLPNHIAVRPGTSRQAIVQAMRGLTEFEASSVLLAGIVATREVSEDVIAHIVREKAQIIRKSGVLEFYDTNGTTMQQVGGLELLKADAQINRATFTTEARSAGVDPAKGVLLVGIPGTGKSLSAKAIAGGQMPLLRMDIGAIMGSYVGQSEANMRSSLKVAEAVAPCVLWLDEIEKGLGGMGGGDHDGGTSMRVFGTLLTWMQETTAPVYVVATANDVRGLRPELLRRFDDIYWVDLPNAASRLQILALHIEKRGQDASLVHTNPDAITARTWGYTGAELEKIVKVAIKTAYFQGKPLSVSHILNAVDTVVPIMQTMGEQINSLRTWSTGRARPAGEPLEARPAPVATANRIADI